MFSATTLPCRSGLGCLFCGWARSDENKQSDLTANDSTLRNISEFYPRPCWRTNRAVCVLRALVYPLRTSVSKSPPRDLCGPNSGAGSSPPTRSPPSDRSPAPPRVRSGSRASSSCSPPRGRSARTQTPVGLQYRVLAPTARPATAAVSRSSSISGPETPSRHSRHLVPRSSSAPGPDQTSLQNRPRSALPEPQTARHTGTLANKAPRAVARPTPYLPADVAGASTNLQASPADRAPTRSSAYRESSSHALRAIACLASCPHAR